MMKMLPLLFLTFASLFATPALAAGPSIEGLITAVIWIIILGLIFWLMWWFVGFVGLPEPFNKVAHVLIGLVAFIFMIYFLLSFLPPLGHGLR